MSSSTSGPAENSNDFVTPNVNDALNEARQVLTHGSVNPSPNERVLQESTSIKVSQSNKDKIEVVIRRSAVSQQDDEAEEFTSYSDSELPQYGKRRGTLPRVGSQENLLNTHTNAKYRRKHGECWRKADMTKEDDATDDEAEIEVDVKEEECLTDSGGHIMMKTWEARWTVQSFECLPDWLQDNEYLKDFHRPPLPSFTECFKSIWSLHTETGNIWTHLVGCVAFFFLAVWYLLRSETHIQLQEKLVFSFFFVGAILCLGLSFTFHTVCCHSLTVSRLFSKLDYMGIALLIIGSFIPWVYYGFYCRTEPKITYISMVCVLGVLTIIISLWDKFSESRFRPLRAGVFVGLGLSGLIPASHFIYTDGIRRLIDENAFYWILAMALLYLFGALLYATRTPERFFPGKCDIIFHSHQLFHVCVVLAAFSHYYGISEMAMNRFLSSCPADDLTETHIEHAEL